MFFSDWQTNTKYKDAEISPTLLWEYDMTNFDWNYMRRVVVERAIKLGDMGDFYAAIKLYGGLDNFIKIIKDEVVSLNKMDISFVKSVFGILPDDLYSEKRRIARAKALGFDATDDFPEWPFAIHSPE